MFLLILTLNDIKLISEFLYKRLSEISEKIEVVNAAIVNSSYTRIENVSDKLYLYSENDPKQ